jgi:D-alanine-D-alanine ligase
MPKKTHVAVVFNEPTVSTEAGRKFISELSKIEGIGSRGQVLASVPAGSVDLSEVGVLEERRQVQESLQRSGYKSSLFNMNGDVRRLLDFLEQEQPDVIFNLCESVGNESVHEMHVAGIYELMGIPYTGAGAFALGTCLNKARTKEILTYHKIPTPRFVVVKNLNELNNADFDLPFPLIVKPSREDASAGIEGASIVDSIAALRRRVRFIFQNFDQPALVEEYIEGRELNVAIIGNKRPIVMPVSEIDFSGLPSHYPKIVTYNAKWMEGTEEYVGTVGKCPAPLDPETERVVKDLALRSYRIMGCRDYARIDLRLDAKGRPFVLEVNPNPDISDDAGFARSSRAYGLTFDEMIARIVEYALERMP